jgi:hypothetical protein
MTYDPAKHGISYRNYFPNSIWSMHDKDFVRVVRKSYRTVPKTLPICWVIKDHFEMALYRTDPYHTIPYRMHVYRTVPYLNPIECVIFARVMANQLSTVRYGTLPYGTAGVCGGVLYRTVQTARANILCGGSWPQAYAQFRYHIIMSARWRHDFAKYWLISLVINSYTWRVALDMATWLRASLPVP